MPQDPDALQFRRRRRFPMFPFIFRISPIGFFIGLFPRRFFFVDAGGMQQDDESPLIRRVSEQDYNLMMRLGIPEVDVAMDWSQ